MGISPTGPMAADAILAIHFLIAAFIVGGYLAIAAGAWRKWDWVRRRAWRMAHLLAIVFVAAEALLGIACPLTVWEDALRGAAQSDSGFVERWLGAVLYWNFPAWAFTVAYAALALLALMLWRWVPPRRR